MSSVARGRLQISLAVAGVLALGVFSLILAQRRIYQVDELQTVYMARILGTHRWNEFMTTASLFLLGPLSWMASHGATTAEILASFRLAFLGVFWLNTVLLAVAAGARRFDARSLTILLFAATLAPLWDYGFEVRHDNILLTAVLAAWILVRHAGRIAAPYRYARVGAIAVLAQFCAFKSFLYFVPMCGLMLLFPNPELGIGRRRALGSALLGAALAFGAALLAQTAAGTLQQFRGGVQGSVTTAENVERFAAWVSLGRFLSETPLIAAGCAAVLALAVRELLTRKAGYFSWATSFPEVLFAAGSFAVLLVNPTPYPYNLLLVVPPAFIAISAAIPAFRELIPPATRALVIGGVVLGHAVPFLFFTARHLGYSNRRQLTLAATAEAMTDPTRDRVYDAAGFVVTRDSIGYFYYLHSLTIKGFWTGRFESVRSMLEKRPASVIIPSYRTTWLPPADQEFIGRNYVALAGDFLVLGAELNESGVWNSLHPGRYAVLVWPPQAAGDVRIDGAAPPQAPLFLSKGPHAVHVPPAATIWVVWVGPSLDRPPNLGPGSLEKTFINFY